MAKMVKLHFESRNSYQSNRGECSYQVDERGHRVKLSSLDETKYKSQT